MSILDLSSVFSKFYAHFLAKEILVFVRHFYQQGPERRYRSFYDDFFRGSRLEISFSCHRLRIMQRQFRCSTGTTAQISDLFSRLEDISTAHERTASSSERSKRRKGEKTHQSANSIVDADLKRRLQQLVRHLTNFKKKKLSFYQLFCQHPKT